MAYDKLFRILGWYYDVKNKEIFFGVGFFIALNAIIYRSSSETKLGSEYVSTALLMGIFMMLAAIRERVKGRIPLGVFAVVLHLIILFNAMAIGQLLVQGVFASQRFFWLFERGVMFFGHVMFLFAVLHSYRISNIMVRALLFLCPIIILVVYVWDFIREARIYIFRNGF